MINIPDDTRLAPRSAAEGSRQRAAGNWQESMAPAQAKQGRLARHHILLRTASGLVALLIVAYLGISGYTADKLSKPARRTLGDVATYNLPYQEVQFASAVDGIPLSGWFIDSPGSRTILMLHGRNGIRDDDTIGTVEIARALVEHNYDVFMFDFRAHGESGGERYSFGQFEVRDVEGALAYLKSRGVTEVGALGFSMGAATALHAAPAHPEMRALVLDTSFADLSLVIEAQLPKASGLPTVFNPGILSMVQLMYGMDLQNNDPVEEVPRLGDRPVLLIQSATDDFVPVEHAYALRDAGAGNPNLSLWVAPGSGHVQSFKNNREEYLRRLLAFFDEYFPRQNAEPWVVTHSSCAVAPGRW